MKKVILASLALLSLAACTGSYHDGKCDYDYLLVPALSISRMLGC